MWQAVQCYSCGAKWWLVETDAGPTRLEQDSFSGHRSTPETDAERTKRYVLSTNYGELVPEDKMLTHQIMDTFATVNQSDPSWTEKIWTMAFPEMGLSAENSFL